jgi:hypothetical protein
MEALTISQRLLLIASADHRGRIAGIEPKETVMNLPAAISASHRIRTLSVSAVSFGVALTAVIGGAAPAASALTRVSGAAAYAATPNVTGAGRGFCNSYGGVSTSGASLDNVYPCADPDISDQFGYQCVEISVRFDSVVYGTNPSWASGGSGANVVNSLHSHGVPVSSPNGSAGGSTSGSHLPVAGDVISMWGSGQDSLGHTGVVSKVTTTGGTGNYTITYLDENGRLSSGGDSIGDETVAVDDWVWQPAFSNSPYQYNVYNWTTQAGGTSSITDNVAFQASNGQLEFYQSGSGLQTTTQGMMAGTSPTITAVSTGAYQAAFQANSGALIVWGALGDKNTGLMMKAGTSPSIAGSSNGGYQVAFQASNGQLEFYRSGSGLQTTTQGMMAGTSPTITAVSTGAYQAAFQANSGALIVWGALGDKNTGLGMLKATSPAIAAGSSGGYVVAFQANSGKLWSTGTAGTTNRNIAMKTATSPAVAAQ